MHEREKNEAVRIWNPYDPICAMVKSRYIGDGHPTFQ